MLCDDDFVHYSDYPYTITGMIERLVCSLCRNVLATTGIYDCLVYGEAASDSQSGTRLNIAALCQMDLANHSSRMPSTLTATAGNGKPPSLGEHGAINRTDLSIAYAYSLQCSGTRGGCSVAAEEVCFAVPRQD